MSSHLISIKPPKPFSSYEKENKILSYYSISQNLLLKKYSNKEYNYAYINTNYLIFNEKCSIVSIFKDYLIYDDSNEFLRKFYSIKENNERLKKIYNFYSTYSQIFPNYLILNENIFLYRNIRKKQRIIDQYNKIKKEEEENRKKLQIGLSSNKKKNFIQIFDKSTQESINRYQPSITNTLLTNKKSLDETKSTISISLYNKINHNNNNLIINESFKDDNNTTLKSFESIINKLDNNNNIQKVNQLEKNLISTPKRENSNNKKSHCDQQTALNNNKTFISHKSTISFNDKKKNIIKTLIIEKKINDINEIKNDFKEKNSPSPEIKSNRENKKENISEFLKEEKRNKNKKNNNKNNFMKEIQTSELKSPISKDLYVNKNIKRPITTTKTINHMMPFYKNKFIEEKLSININKDNSDSINNYSSFINKVNPLKIKLEKKKNSNNKKHNTLNSFGNLNKKSFISSFNLNNPKEIKKNLLTEGNIKKVNNSNQRGSSTIINTGNENNNNYSNSKNNNINIKDMKNQFKIIIEKNKIIRNSYDPQCNFFNKFHSHNSLSVNNNKNKYLNLKSQRKIKNIKTSIDQKKTIISPIIRIPFTVLQNKIKNYNNFNFCTPVNKTFKLNLNLKDKILDKQNSKNMIKKINFKVIDSNTKKMKFIKK